MEFIFSTYNDAEIADATISANMGLTLEESSERWAKPRKCDQGWYIPKPEKDEYSVGVTNYTEENAVITNLEEQ